MNVIFMGTPDFALSALEGLFNSKDHTVTAVVTQPDKVRGRRGKPVPTPVGKYASDNGIRVFTPERVRDDAFLDEIKDIPCDVIVVVAFGQILPESILNLPKYGCVNVHASLLPRWRGAAPMQWAILEGDEKTGVTTMQMDAGLDTGDMLLKRETDITSDKNIEELHDELAKMGSDLLLETLEGLEKGTVESEKQDDEKSTYAKMLTKDMGKVDFSWPAEKIERYVRALVPWPGVYTGFEGKTLKLHKVEIVSDEELHDGTGEGDEKTAGDVYSPGTVVRADANGIVVATGDGAINILELQAEGKRRMAAGDFLNGNQIGVGIVLE